MVDIPGLTSLFSQVPSMPFQSIAGYQAGYAQSNFDILYQGARRTSAVAENKIFDFIQVENDSNYLRSYATNSSKLTDITSKLSMSSQITTVLNAQMHLLGVAEYIPSNIENLLFNYQSLSNSGVNLLNTINQGVTFKSITAALLADITLQFGNGTITYQQLVQMENVLSNKMQLVQSIKNNGLAPLLSLGLQDFLPSSMLGIFTTAQYLDTLYDLFQDTNEASLFTSNVSNNILTYAPTQLSAIVETASYTNNTISFDDSLGTNAQDAFKSELGDGYTEALNTAVNNSIPSGMSTSDFDEIKEVLYQDAYDNIDSGFQGQIGLPSLYDVARGIQVASYNGTVSAVAQAFTNFSQNIVQSLGFAPTPIGTRPADYLINLKTNLQTRLNLKKYGSTTTDFNTVNNYLKSVILDGNISDAQLQYLHDKLIDTLKLSSEI